MTQDELNKHVELHLEILNKDISGERVEYLKSWHEVMREIDNAIRQSEN